MSTQESSERAEYGQRPSLETAAPLTEQGSVLSSHAVNRIACVLIILMICMTTFMGFAMQTRWASPLVDNFVQQDQLGWIGVLEYHKGVREGTIIVPPAENSGVVLSDWERWQYRFRMTVDNSQNELVNFLYYTLTPFSIPVLSLATLGATCWLAVCCGGLISRSAAWLSGAAIAFNPHAWIWPMGVAKEPSMLLIAALVMTAIMKPRVPRLLLFIAVLLGLMGFPLRPEPVLVIGAIGVLCWFFLKSGRENIAVCSVVAIAVLVGMATWLEFLQILGLRVNFYNESMYERFQPQETTAIREVTYWWSAELYQDTLVRPVGMALNSGILLLNPMLRPAGIGEEGVLVLQAGRWISKFLCALALIASITHFIRWKKADARSLALSGVVITLLLMAVSYPVLVDRYFYPALVFAVPLLFMLPAMIKRGLLYVVVIVSVLGPLLLLSLGHPPPVEKNYLIIEAYQNPMLPGSAYVPGSMVSDQMDVPGPIQQKTD